VPGDNLKHRYIDITEVVFWAGQEEGNEFKVPLEHLKHRFLKFIEA